jgi:hypothetical protein
MTRRRVWVVERDHHDGEGWVPFYATRFSREQARREARMSKKYSHAGDRFRVRKYTPSGYWIGKTYVAGG